MVRKAAVKALTAAIVTPTASSVASAGHSQLSWHSLNVPPDQLRIDITLCCGQSFRWVKTDVDQWSCALNGYLVSLKQTDNDVLFAYHNKSHPNSSHKDKPSTSAHTYVEEVREMLRDYLNLNVDLHSLYQTWTKLDPNFARVAKGLLGIRILRQDPTENLFSFICSSNNNISRITLMINRMCSTYGTANGQVNDIQFYDFPSVDALAQNGVEDKLRQLGFGYRAKYIGQSAKLLSTMGGSEFLNKLRKVSYEEAHTALQQFQGVGAKVADCVCLMSLDKHDAIPVDVHMRRIADETYCVPYTKSKSKKSSPKKETANNNVSSESDDSDDTTDPAASNFNNSPLLESPKPKGKSEMGSLSAKGYKDICDYFKNLWGPYAGWAHTVLFSSALKRFEERVPDHDGGENIVTLNGDKAIAIKRVKLESTSDESHTQATRDECANDFSLVLGSTISLDSAISQTVKTEANVDITTAELTSTVPKAKHSTSSSRRKL